MFMNMSVDCCMCVLSHLCCIDIRSLMKCAPCFQSFAASHFKSISDTGNWRIHLDRGDSPEKTLGSFERNVDIKLVKTLHLRLLLLSYEELSSVASNLVHRLESLRSLTLALHEVGLSATKLFLEALPASDMLESLRLVDLPSTNESEFLEDSLKRLISLTRLCWDVDASGCIYDHNCFDALVITRSISSLGTLQDLEINLRHTHWKRPRISIPPTLVNLTKLTSLPYLFQDPVAKFDVSRVIQNQLRHLDACIGEVDLGNLQHLTFLRVHNVGFVKNWSHAPTGLVELRCTLVDRYERSLDEMVAHMHSLQKLSIAWLGHCTVWDATKLISALSSFDRLESLELRGSSEAPNEMTLAVSSFPEFKSLKCLVLDFHVIRSMYARAPRWLLRDATVVDVGIIPAGVQEFSVAMCRSPVGGPPPASLKVIKLIHSNHIDNEPADEGDGEKDGEGEGEGEEDVILERWMAALKRWGKSDIYVHIIYSG
jgi:hypothetical protein